MYQSGRRPLAVAGARTSGRRREARIRILHTADWHLGHELAGWAREGEQQAVLDEIAALALARDVDALVIAGDVFDHQNPSSSMVRLLFDFFEHLATRRALTVVMIAGNHDSVGRLEAPSSLLRLAHVHAIGAIQRRDGAIDLDRHLVPVARGGETIGHILAIPYLRPADLPGFLAFDGAPEASAEAGVRRLYGEALQAARARGGDLPLIATGHLHVRGGQLSESLAERHILIGGEHAVPADAFGELADYVALGHLHKAQTLGAGARAGAKGAARGNPKRGGRVRYAGSPLPLSVAERSYDHGVSIVDLAGRKLAIEHVSLTRPVPFLRLPDEGRLAFDEVAAALDALALDPALPQHQWPFVQVHIDVREPQPGLRARLDDLLALYPLRSVSPEFTRPGGAERSQTPAGPLERLSELQPEDLFARAFLARHGTEPDAAHLACFRRLLEEAGQ